MFQLYGEVTPYTEQLRKLEKNAADKPKSAELRFLVGYLYMVTGYKDAARDEFLAALKLTPHDRVAAELLESQGGTVPAEIAAELAKESADTPPSANRDIKTESLQPLTPPAPQMPTTK